MYSYDRFTKSDARGFFRAQLRCKAGIAAERLPIIGASLQNKHHNPVRYGDTPILDQEKSRQIIIDAIEAGRPFMAGRFGAVEGSALESFMGAVFRYGDDCSRFPQKNLDMLCKNAGFFPNDKSAAWKWCEMEYEACRHVDLLGVMYFLNEGWICRNLCPQAALTPNGALGSAQKNWTHVLKGRKVLVVHPFTDTIKKQYSEKRELIYPGYDTLPEFELKCVKAVQTIADSRDERFDTWFEALDYMTEEIRKQDFDVCLLGCGAYGFQLAARVKQMGKIAVHMGGCLQTLFGIRGSRWDKNYSYWFNDAWVSPSEEERPQGFEKIEGGCYW